MNTVEDRLAALEAQVAALSERLAAAPPPPPAPEGTFWALDGLKQRLPTDGSGAVLYTGTVRVAGQHYDWQYGRTVDDLLAADWTELPSTLSALAHPVRLRLLREILGGRQSTSELAEIEELGTTGQLHHHLRQITAAGWLRSAGRGRYAVPAERVVPLLAILTAAGR
ncbi:helix-turn-helix domain-containing protein [Micromonospora noduli]|uniref:DNA topoisomerase (ATP-hydrolyzing) n=1 Tax=Micromonospora noduli TaxID=709876 RepID=A0A328N2C7_9ACTN|nr:helix-turn-helix domain-containing protein [Micromonospora noduli]RAO00148.1 DNA topoisomerase (ATP-hydrolyzing) [Micromonospora noduli]RAO08577.1 DNA topoisomerase (ATP-hydrolyzing) [Micromonospora noduli]RAO19306.1 DNA topoisomerase (ATP-hydrolyzing) [Micromonospora noduli]RAO25830.1 DNA topoisomerase (ATP-hydrolyzing) [Micromonospora noduli]RAO53618.1 DNA topoisomerase (ATP-hydrolyzing) [Micromonospora noduli]